MIAFGISRKELKIFLERSLRRRERELFLKLYDLQGLTFSSAVRKLSEYGFPQSTAKYLLKKLKQLNLVDFGNKDLKGKSLFLNDLGKTFLEILRSDNDEVERS